MAKARALVVKAAHKLELQELEIPDIGNYEVLFHVKSSSLCTVDRRTYMGIRSYQLPFLGGHECSGIVEKVGKGVSVVQPGDKAIFTSAYCMQCDFDRRGRGTQCKHKYNGTRKRAEFEGGLVGGGLCEYLRIPAWQVIKLPDDIDLDHACLTEPLACCIHSIRKARIEFGDTVVIIGAGIMGYMQIKLALMRGARVIVSEIDPDRREKALKGGAHIAIDPSVEHAAEVVRSMTNGEGADVVINTIPTHSIWASAISMLAPFGRLLAYSSQDSKEPVGIDFGLVHSKEIEFIGTVNPTLEDNDLAVKLIGYHMIDMNEVINGTYPFDESIRAFQLACEPGAYRVIINF